MLIEITYIYFVDSYFVENGAFISCLNRIFLFLHQPTQWKEEEEGKSDPVIECPQTRNWSFQKIHHAIRENTVGADYSWSSCCLSNRFFNRFPAKNRKIQSYTHVNYFQFTGYEQNKITVVKYTRERQKREEVEKALVHLFFTWQCFPYFMSGTASSTGCRLRI